MSAAARTALLACPLFDGLPREALDEIATGASLRTVRAGDTIIREGEEGECLFVIAEGRARTEKRTPSGDAWTVRFYEKGGVFGEPRSSTACAARPRSSPSRTARCS